MRYKLLLLPLMMLAFTGCNDTSTTRIGWTKLKEGETLAVYVSLGTYTFRYNDYTYVKYSGSVNKESGYIDFKVQTEYGSLPILNSFIPEMKYFLKPARGLFLS